MSHTLLHRQCKQVITILTQHIAHQPGGYLWWNTLPKKGRHSQPVLIRNWASLLYTTLFSPHWHKAMLVACLDENGKPDNRGILLYKWLLEYVYNRNVNKLYQDWLATTNRLI